MNLKTPNDMTPEEAQAIIKANMKDMAKIVQDAIGVLHPELRESEDERIRKEIRNFLIDMECKKEWIAYMEKQKECVADSSKTSADEDERIRAVILKLVLGMRDEIFTTADKSVTKPKVLAWLEKQKEPEPITDSIKFEEGFKTGREFERLEQKPAEWSEDWREEDIQTRFAFYTYKDDPSVLYLSNVFVEETSRNHGFGTRILRAAEKVAETIGATTISLKVKQDSPANAWYRKNGYGYVAFEDGNDWLEKNLEYMKPQPKKEWSEEDEKIRQSIIKDIEFERNYTSATTGRVSEKYNEQINWLKLLSLNRKKMNEDVAKLCSNEWSEEDEEMLHRCINATFDHGYLKDCDFLKSLRPQPHKEIYQVAKHDLAIKFMNYLDENRPEGKMSLSNAECEDIDKAFKENDWAKILRYAEKYGKRIELWIFPTGNVAVYRGSAFIPTEQLTKEERLFVLNRVYNELKGEDLDLDAEIKKYTENLYNETFGNGQGTLDEFDWEDIAAVIEDAARHFYNLRPSWKPSAEQIEALERTIRLANFGAEENRRRALESLHDQLKKLI